MLGVYDRGVLGLYISGVFYEGASLYFPLSFKKFLVHSFSLFFLYFKWYFK